MAAGIETNAGKFDAEALKQSLRRAARSAVITHALAAADVAYQIYPVGPEAPHIRDGTPHTRDTFQILVDGEVIAEQGEFYTAEALGTESDGPEFTVALRASGAAFFVEFGTIFMEAQPILRMVVRQAQADISADLRQLNLEYS
jgi:hypothetical protein